MCMIFLDSTYKWYLSFSDFIYFIYLVWSSLGPAVFLQIALFHYFLRLSNIPVCVCVYRHRVFFHVIAVINSDAVNIEVHTSFWISVFLFLDIRPGMGLLDHMATLFLAFYGTSILFSLVAAPIYIPINYVGVVLFSAQITVFVTCKLFDDGHSDWWKVIPHCSFDFHFSNN